MFRTWNSPAAAFQLLKKLSAGQPCDFSGITDHGMLADQGGVQWPYPAGTTNDRVERRLFEDGRFFHVGGRARFCYEAPRALPELPTDKYPFLLLTGRGSAAQWHTQTRTAKSAVLRKLYPREPYVEINPQDAAGLGIRTGCLLRVSSQRGELRARALVTPAVQMGQIFLPMHDEQTNVLTHAAFDPYSNQPAYKSCALVEVIG
jgi:assimilatory nitrate reductase catalytic subunit